MAPGMLCMPPMTTAGKASRPMFSMSVEASCNWPRNTPPMAASVLPMAQASRFITLTFTPETTAASCPSAVARISRPTDVNRKNAPNAAMQAQLTSAAVRCNWETRTSPTMKTPVGRGVVRLRPWGPKMISITARNTIDSAMVNMITASIGRPASGWINNTWITTPRRAAATMMKITASGNGNCSRVIEVTAKKAPQTTNMPCAKLNTSVALKTTANPRATRP